MRLQDKDTDFSFNYAQDADRLQVDFSFNYAQDADPLQGFQFQLRSRPGLNFSGLKPGLRDCSIEATMDMK